MHIVSDKNERKKSNVAVRIAVHLQSKDISISPL